MFSWPYVRLLPPGLVDGHTHPVWAGDRVHEFAMKLAGASYMEVQNSLSIQLLGSVKIIMRPC